MSSKKIDSLISYIRCVTENDEVLENLELVELAVKDLVQDKDEEMEELKQENAKYREALKQILVETKDCDNCEGNCTFCYNGYLEPHELAKKALED